MARQLAGINIACIAGEIQDRMEVIGRWLMMPDRWKTGHRGAALNESVIVCMFVKL